MSKYQFMEIGLIILIYGILLAFDIWLGIGAYKGIYNKELTSFKNDIARIMFIFITLIGVWILDKMINNILNTNKENFLNEI